MTAELYASTVGRAFAGTDLAAFHQLLESLEVFLQHLRRFLAKEPRNLRADSAGRLFRSRQR